MLSITIAQLKTDIIAKMKGTSLRQVTDFNGTAAAAANRMLARIDPEETRRTVTLSTPFYDNVNDYALVTDYKRMIDIRPQANLLNNPGSGGWSQTTPEQFRQRLTANSFSIRWNSMVRSLRAQVLPSGNIAMMDPFDAATGNGTWTAEGDASGLYSEPLNFVEGNGSLGMNLSGATGAGDIVNSTATVTDLSLYRYEDASALFIWIPIGSSARFTSFSLRRGSSSSNYVQASVTTKADGTVFTDGWNFLLFQWSSATTVGSPDDTKNTYRRFGIAYNVGTAINGFLIDNWTDSLGNLYEMEYYSEYMFRTSAGVWIQAPTSDTDLVNIGPSSYEIFKTEMMVDITQQIRSPEIAAGELADWRMMLNGQPQTRYVKDPPYHGLYGDYLSKWPSSAIVTSTSTYDFDL